MSCTDVQTIQAGNGTKTQFSFDFPYIFKSEIHVYFWNATTKEYDEKLTTDATYPWRITDANPTIVEFTGTAPPAPATPVDPGESTVDNVKIRRITQIDDIRALFNPGSAIRSDDLNNNFEQLKYAIQEANCQGIPDDVDQYLKDYYWDRFDNTLYSADTWRSDDATIATTAALDQRFQDEVNETFTKAELAAASDVMPDNDVAVPTTGAVKDYVDHVVETDILVDGTGLNKTTSSGQVTIGISADSVDFDRIKDADKVQLADQNADYDLAGGDDKVFTASAAIRRFENYVQNNTPSGTGVGKGAVWVDVDDDLTLSVWNGSAWVGITSGGTFTNQPKVVYVDASSGDDSNDGHRISRPKATIKAAVNQINTDSTYGDGSVIIVAAGVYQEAAPIQIQKKNVSIIGQALRSCIVHPTVATQGDQSSGNHALFELNSGSYIANLTLTGMKANNTGTNTVDSTLPSNQGWNFAFYSGATITKSPYIQNCTNFSDSEIDNSDLNANTPAGGLAGDTDSAPTGGGALIDGSVVDSNSPLRSMVCDSYTHVGLNGPGILVTNNGYCQATSSYAFFNKYHIKCLNGGQANLAASTTDFGDQALVADGKSTAAIFTSNVDGAASDGDLTFNINEPTAGAGWFGDTERPATNMLVEVNSVIYPILSATANTDSEGGAGWTVKISRPNPSNRSENLGLDGAVSDNAAVSFYLRSMIASSGHTMEYVGSGTDYRALPENGGVPNETKQITESNNGKVWTAITDHNGKFKIGGNQTDDPIFEVDQQLGFVTIPEGSIAFNLLSDLTPQLGGDLDVNGNTITSASNGNVVIDPDGTGTINVGATITSNATDQDINIEPDGNGDLKVVSSTVEISDSSANDASKNSKFVGTHYSTTEEPTALIGVSQASNVSTISIGGGYSETNAATSIKLYTAANNTTTTGSPRLTIDSSGNVGIGTASPLAELHLVGTDSNGGTGTAESSFLITAGGNQQFRFLVDQTNKTCGIQSTEATVGNKPLLLNPSGGNVGIGTASINAKLEISGNSGGIGLRLSDGENLDISAGGSANDPARIATSSGSGIQFAVNGTSGENMRIDSSGRLLVGTPASLDTNGVFQVKSDTGGIIHFYEGGNTTPVRLRLSKSRGDTTAAISGDGLGEISFRGRETSNNLRNAATIAAEVDGTPGASSVPGRLVFSTTASNSSSPSPRMYIDSSGNVGIGTTSPSYKLHLAGTGDVQTKTSNGTAAIRFGITSGNEGIINLETGHDLTLHTSNTEQMRIDSSGNVGIGGTPTNDASTTTFEVITDATTARMIIKSNAVGGGKYGWYTNNEGQFAAYDYNAASERMRIDSSGNVGIGTSSPTDLLHIRDAGTDADTAIKIGNDSRDWVIENSGSNSDTFKIYNDLSSSIFNITSGGNVGIGTTAPTERLQVTDGTNSNFYIAPGYNSDAGTLLGVGGSEYISFATNGLANERMRIDSSGNVGIGTSGASKRLHVRHDGDSYPVLVQNRTNSGSTCGIALIATGSDFADGQYATIEAISGGAGTTRHDLAFRTCTSGGTPTERMRISSDGRFGVGRGIGTDDGIFNIQVGTGALHIGYGSGYDNYWTCGSGAVQVFRQAASENMRIDSSGHLIVGKSVADNSTDGITLFSYGIGSFVADDSRSGTFVRKSSDGSVVEFRRDAATVGSISVTTTATAYNTSSDYRLKENVVNVTDGITRVKQLSPKRFNFIADAETTVDGFIAHEVQTIVPEAITGEKDAMDDEGDPVYQGIDQSKLVPLLTAALQEAIAKIETLESKVAALEAAN